MIHDTIRKIEQALRADGTPTARRQELLRLLAELKEELRAVESTHRDEARAIARLTEAAHAAARQDDPAKRRKAADVLVGSVRDFEASHPKLIAVVEAIAESLAVSGI